MIYIHYWLLYFKNDNCQCTTASQRLTFNSFSLFYIFFISSFSFLLSHFKLSCKKKRWDFNRLQGLGVESSPSYFFSGYRTAVYWLLTWNLAHILSNLKTFKEAIKAFWIRRNNCWGHHISAFSAGNLAFTCFCYIANFSSIFSLLFGFLWVSMSFL